MKLVINVAGTEQVRRTLTRMSRRIGDPTPAYEAIADQIGVFMQRQFTAEGGAVTGRWTPLSPEYRKRKDRIHPGQPILVATGALRRDYTQRPFGYEKMTTRSFSMGSALPYAKAHQKGTRHIPRRPLELDEAARRQMTKTLQRFIVSGKV